MTLTWFKCIYVHLYYCFLSTCDLDFFFNEKLVNCQQIEVSLKKKSLDQRFFSAINMMRKVVLSDQGLLSVK